MGRTQRRLRIWIDFANSPHPLLFAPVARLLEAKGHQVVVTVRDNAQTLELARAQWPSCTLIGGESPANPVAKAAVLMLRAFHLARWARSQHLDLALSHNSYAQILAARMLGVPVLTAADFEHQPANHLAFRLATRILMPEAMRMTNVRQKGATPDKSVFYPGFKEELYIGDFEPDMEILSKLEIERTVDQVVVVTRPPPTRAIYHRFPNPLFGEILQALDRAPNIRLVVLARHTEQREAIRSLDLHQVLIPGAVVDSRSLMYAADLVIGAGGTMNREAALLGVPTVTVYRGSQPAVDRRLEEQGLLRVIRNAADIGDPAPRATEPRTLDELRQRGTELSEIFVSTIETTAQAS
jgi:predicted glycosyltransferase